MCLYLALSSTIADHIAKTMKQIESGGPSVERTRVGQLEFCSNSRRPTRVCARTRVARLEFQCELASPGQSLFEPGRNRVA